MEFLNAGLEVGPLKLVVWELLYIIVLVLVLRAVLDRLLFQPIMGVLDERARRLDSAQGGHEELLAEVEKSQAEQARLLAEARREAKQALDATKAECDEARRSRLDEARQKASASVDEATARVEKASQEAEKKLRDEASTLAGSIATAVLGRQVAS